MQIFGFIFLCLTIGSILDDIDSSFAESNFKQISPSDVGLTHIEEAKESEEVRLGDVGFVIDPEYNVEVGTMNDLLPDDHEEEVGKEMEWKMDPKAEVEVGTMSEEELGDSLAHEPELREGHITDFDEFGVERSTGYSLQNEADVGEESEVTFTDPTLQHDDPITLPEEDADESPVGETRETSLASSATNHQFDKVNDVDEGTYLSESELKKLDEAYLPKVDPMDEPDMKDLETEVGADENSKGDGDEEPVNRILISHYEMDPTYEVEKDAIPDADAWAKDVKEYGYKEPENTIQDDFDEKPTSSDKDSKETAVGGDAFEKEMDDTVKKMRKKHHYDNDINGEADALETESSSDDTEVGDYDSDKKKFFDLSGMHVANIEDDFSDDTKEATVKLDKAHEAALKKEEAKSHGHKKHSSHKHSHSSNEEEDLSLPDNTIIEEEAVGMNAVELKNTYKDACGEEHFIHFDRLGDKTVNPNSWYKYDFGPFQARLHGWSHTRKYANGFLCNGERGCSGKMRLQIHNVDFFQAYEFKLYMLGVQHYGTQMNRARIETADEPWGYIENVKWPRQCHAANKCPYARKGIVTTKRGPLVFRFHRDSHHVQLSGISLRKYCGPRFQASLAAKNSVPAKVYEFQRVTLVVRGGDFKERMRKQCNQIGMKPLCDHPSYCRHDYNSIYLGQSHHLCHGGQARSGHMPQGFKHVAGMFDSTCCYTAGHGGSRALCSHGNSHRWMSNQQGGAFGGASSFVCGRYAPFTMSLQAFRNVQPRTYEFEMMQTDHYGGHYAHVMRWECARIAMKPVCDHPSYCQNDWNSVYMGQHHHLAYRPYRKVSRYFPKNFKYIWQYWDTLCTYSGNRGNALCNIPWNTHSWRHSSEYSGAFMCARAWRPEPFKRSLGARNSVPRQRWEFQPYYMDNRHGNIKDIMRRECGRVGMKPTCDHPSYCKRDYRSWYLGQNHHLEYPGHRNNKGYWPNGWMAIRHQWDGTCAYTAGHGGANALCNIPSNTHSWRNIYSGGSMNTGGATSFVCASPGSFIQRLGSKNGVPGLKYEFQIVSVEQRGGSWHHLSLEECSNIGMRPICDHPSYCKTDYRSIYIGQTWHIAYPPHRNNMGLFPDGWEKIRNRWDGLCSYTAHHGGGRFLCNIPRNTHAWRHPDDDANSIMCGKVAPFEAALGPKNGVPGRSYEFQMVTWKKWHGWSINGIMVQSCREIGMKPVCDHPHYCKHDQRSIYIGQTHHIAYPGHRNNMNFFPRGWEGIKDNWRGICSYTAHHGHNGHRTLCNTNINTHSWQGLHWGANTWICARIKGFSKVLGARKNSPRRRIEFRIVESNLGGMRFDKAQLAECSSMGMKPICDHPNYCKNSPQTIYLGQDHHLAYKPHRNNNNFWPSGFSDIRDQWNGLCTFTAGHGTGGLCNIPLNTHSWQKISSYANRFMCGRVAPFQSWLDAGKDSKLGERRYSFRVVTTGQRGGKMSEMMQRECTKFGMKPVCDHPNYCKNDRNAIYIGQKHSISLPKHRDNKSYFPKGWSFIKNNFHGVCMYTAGHGSGKALCNFPFNTHSWRALDDNFNTFVCGKVIRFRKKLGAKNGVPARDYTFEMVKVGEKAKGKRFSQVMLESCAKRGMKPICDHPNYCRSNSKALYLGQNHHLSYWPHRNNNAFWPSGWATIKKDWDGMCAYTANHGTGALCNIPRNTHSWQNPSDLANTFMCGRIASMKADLGGKNGVSGKRYEFRVIQTDVRSGKFCDVQITECEKVGMKPICDHRSYCRNDKKSLYLGQDHHLAHPSHRNKLSFFPSGWSKVKHLWEGMCTYTSSRGPKGTTLCNIPKNTHSWQKLGDKANSFVCGRLAPEDDDGKATEAACQMAKGFKVTPSKGASKKSRQKTYRKCERWCEKNASMENGCQYEDGNCILLKPGANEGKFEDKYSGYGCLFTRYSDLSKFRKHGGGIKISKDKFSATLPKGRKLESSKKFTRNAIVTARIKASSSGCISMSLFNDKRDKNAGLTIETGASSKKAKAIPTGKSVTFGSNTRWHEVRIASYLWGPTEYYVNGKLIDKSEKKKDTTEGRIVFIAQCQNMEVKNVKMWEVCGGKGVKKGEKEEHAKGKEKHDKITGKLKQCTARHRQLQQDVIKQQRKERMHNAKGNHWCRNRDNMKRNRDNMKGQRDKVVRERDQSNKEQQGMESERNQAKSQRDTMRRQMESEKRLLNKAHELNKNNARGCYDKKKEMERKNTNKYATTEERRKTQDRNLKGATKRMNHKWRTKVSRSLKVKGREQMNRQRFRRSSEQYYKRTKECNDIIRNSGEHWRKKLQALEDKKTTQSKGVDKAKQKMTSDFKKKIQNANDLGRKNIGKCKRAEKSALKLCEKQKDDQNERWTLKYRKLEEYWNKKIEVERTEGGRKIQAKFNKLLSRCKATGRKEDAECIRKLNACKLEGKGYYTRMKGHEKLERIAIKMKREADRNFSVMKKKYEGKMAKYQRCVKETRESDKKHEGKHQAMARELEGHLIQHAACMKRHAQGKKLVDNYKKMFKMIRTNVNQLRTQTNSETKRSQDLQEKLVKYEGQCGKLEKGWKIKYDVKENKAVLAEKDQRDAEKEYRRVDAAIRALDKKYKYLQRAKGEDEKTWLLRISKAEKEVQRAKKLEEKKIKDREKRWATEKKKLVKKEDETHDQYNARVTKAKKTFSNEEKDFQKKWQTLVGKITRKQGETDKQFRGRVKKAYSKYRQVSDYVGRFKQAKKQHREDVAQLKVEFRKETENQAKVLKEYSVRLHRWKEKADDERSRLVDAVRRQNRDLREAKKEKMRAEQGRAKVKREKKGGEQKYKERIKKGMSLKQAEVNFDEKWKRKVQTNEDRLEEKVKKANEYWTKRFDVEKKAVAGATKNEIADELRGILQPRYDNKIKDLSGKTKDLSAVTGGKVKSWRKRTKSMSTKYRNQLKEMEKGTIRQVRQIRKEKKLEKQNDQLSQDLTVRCNDNDGSAGDAKRLASDNKRMHKMLRKREDQIEEMRDEFRGERRAARRKKKTNRKDIKDLTKVAAHLQEKLEKLEKLSSMTEADSAEAHVSKATHTLERPQPVDDSEPFYTQFQ